MFEGKPQNKDPYRYFVIENGTTVFFSGLAPAEIKAAAHRICRKKKDWKLNKAMDAIVRKFGFSQGFGRYSHEFPMLQEFMQERELLQECDLAISISKGLPLTPISRVALSHRLLVSGLSLPKRIFTGYDVDWSILNLFSGPELKVKNNHFIPYEKSVRMYEREGNLGFLFAAAEIMRMWLHLFGNLVGDQLIDTGTPSDSSSWIPFLYKASQEDLITCRDAMRTYRFLIEKLDRGWVEVVKHPDSEIVFLKGPKGRYLLCLPDERDSSFSYSPFGKKLPNQHIPQTFDAFSFRKWYYFNFTSKLKKENPLLPSYTGWYEKAEHEAETAFYLRGRTGGDYPEHEDVIKQFIILEGLYRNDLRLPNRQTHELDGFKKYDKENSILYVSDLVSIKEMQFFLNENPDYVKNRPGYPQLERLDTANTGFDVALPAAVTWYDAMAYTAWMERKFKMLMRFPSLQDYEFITTTVHHDTDPYERSPKLYDVKNMIWAMSKDGNRFLVHNAFAEWLFDSPGASVASYFGPSFQEKNPIMPDEQITFRRYHAPLNPYVSPLTDRFAPDSTGEYKKRKIGFRLCYEMARPTDATTSSSK